MKKCLLMLSLIPCLVLAQEAPEKRIKMYHQIKQLQQSSSLRSDKPIILDSVYVYDTLNERLSSISRYTNNEQGRPKMEIRESISHNEEYANQYAKEEYLYSDKNGEMIAETFYYMLPGEEWVPSWKYEYTYNESDKQSERREFRYKEDAWVLNSKMTVTGFDEKGYATTVIDSIFETDELQVIKQELVYSEDYTRADSKFFFLDEESAEWIHVQINEFIFDNNGNLIHDKATERYEGEEWLPYYEIAYTYDERNRLIREEESETNGLISSFRHQNFYSDNLVTKNESIQSLPTIFISTDSESGTIKIETKEEETGIISIINTSGKKILNQRLEAQQTLISTASLPKGVYFIQVTTPKSGITEKIIVR